MLDVKTDWMLADKIWEVQMPKHIAIVDDDSDGVTATKTRLEAAGYRVSSTCGSGSTQDLIRFQPDLVLLDVSMPELDGFAILREIKRNADLATIPVIIFSGKPKETIIDLFGPEGISGFISKPYEPAELLRTIQSALNSPQN